MSFHMSIRSRCSQDSLINLGIQIVSGGFLLRCPRQHYRADDCNQQKHAGDLERQRCKTVKTCSDTLSVTSYSHRSSRGNNPALFRRILFSLFDCFLVAIRKSPIPTVYCIEKSAKQHYRQDDPCSNLIRAVENPISAPLFRADIDQHDHEKEKNHDPANIDKDLNTGNKLGPEQDKKRCNRNKRRDQK